MWTVVVSDEERAWFTGRGAKLRALDFALRRTEELRPYGRVRIIVEGNGSCVCARARHDGVRTR